MKQSLAERVAALLRWFFNTSPTWFADDDEASSRRDAEVVARPDPLPRRLPDRRGPGASDESVGR